MLTGTVFLSDVAGAPIFVMLVLGFLSYECTWAMGTISKTKDISKAAKKKSKPDKGKTE